MYRISGNVRDDLLNMQKLYLVSLSIRNFFTVAKNDKHKLKMFQIFPIFAKFVTREIKRIHAYHIHDYKCSIKKTTRLMRWNLKMCIVSFILFISHFIMHNIYKTSKKYFQNFQINDKGIIVQIIQCTWVKNEYLNEMNLL